VQQQHYQLALASWTMDINDPDELVSIAVDPKAGANSFFTGYDNPDVANLSREAERETDPTKRRALYSKVQRISAADAFMGFLYYSEGVGVHSARVHGLSVRLWG